jgi:ABC-type multidrug transport system ATPase subunit
MTPPLLSVENLFLMLETAKGPREILKGITFDIAEREVVGLVGESGSGKTTLLNLIYGEIKPSHGRIRYHGQELTSNELYQAGDAVSQSYRSKESGGIHSFDLNGALNFYDRFYVGATLGLYSVNYDRTSEYNEDFTDKDGNGHGGYTLGNDFWVDGSGVDFKLGFILRPFESLSVKSSLYSLVLS